MSQERLANETKTDRRKFILGAGALAVVAGFERILKKGETISGVGGRNIVEAQSEHRIYLPIVEKEEPINLPDNLPDLRQPQLSDEEAAWFLNHMVWGHFSIPEGGLEESGMGKYLGYKIEAEKVLVGVDCDRNSGGEYWIEVIPKVLRVLLTTKNVETPTPVTSVLVDIYDQRTVQAALEKYWVPNRDPVCVERRNDLGWGDGRWSRLVVWRSIA